MLYIIIIVVHEKNERTTPQREKVEREGGRKQKCVSYVWWYDNIACRESSKLAAAGAGCIPKNRKHTPTHPLINHDQHNECGERKSSNELKTTRQRGSFLLTNNAPARDWVELTWITVA